MKNLKILGLPLIGMLLLACGGTGNGTGSAPAIRAERSMENMKSAQPDILPDRKIIKEGFLNFETRDVAETESMIVKTTGELKGYIEKESANEYSDRKSQTVVIRVPAASFDALIAKISEGALRIESKEINSKDVTEEYIDIEARLKTKKDLENRYRDLLLKASKVEEIMSIEKEMEQLRSDIDSIEGRLKYLKDQVALSSLTVTFYQKTYSSFGFGSKFGQALKYGWKNLMWFFIGLTTIWPFILIIAAGLYAGFRINRMHKQKRK
jgi:hypothetical protein